MVANRVKINGHAHGPVFILELQPSLGTNIATDDHTTDTISQKMKIGPETN